MYNTVLIILGLQQVRIQSYGGVTLTSFTMYFQHGGVTLLTLQCIYHMGCHTTYITMYFPHGGVNTCIRPYMGVPHYLLQNVSPPVRMNPVVVEGRRFAPWGCHTTYFRMYFPHGGCHTTYFRMYFPHRGVTPLTLECISSCEDEPCGCKGWEICSMGGGISICISSSVTSSCPPFTWDDDEGTTLLATTKLSAANLPPWSDASLCSQRKKMKEKNFKQFSLQLPYIVSFVYV